MKATKQTISTMRKLMREALAFHNVAPDAVVTDAHRWQLWSWICAEVKSSDDHPRFINRARLFPHDFDFPIYPNDMNDDTLKTALRCAMRGVEFTAAS